LLHGRAEIVATIQAIQRAHFYKSMTAHGNTRLWAEISCQVALSAAMQGLPSK